MDKKNNIKGELHLIIIWNKGRNKQAEILEDLQNHLTIKNVVEVSWAENLIKKNYARFYGCKLEEMRSKIKECGTGSFLLITVIDKNPIYEYIETSRGHEMVNKNIFILKQRYREWTDGGHKIHATNSVQETDHDLTLLVGKNSSDYLAQNALEWDGNINSINQNLVGTDGWESLEQLFYVLNNTIEYFVMRNHEMLPQEFKSEAHGDIDIQVSDMANARLIMDAKFVHKTPERVHCKTNVNGETVLWDIRHTSDDYYCANWQRDLMHNRILNKKFIYVLNDNDYFYTLVY